MIAWLSARLLGVWRSLGITLMSGVAGWSREPREKGTDTLLPLLRKAPRRSGRIATLIERDAWTARVSLFSDDRDVQTVTALINRIVLAFLGGVVESSRGFCLTRRGGPSLRATPHCFSSLVTLDCSAAAY
jgi:hypothetical protein